jgi:hypothetical protein
MEAEAPAGIPFATTFRPGGGVYRGTTKRKWVRPEGLALLLRLAPAFRFARFLLAEELHSASAAAGRFLFRFRKRAASGHDLKLSCLTDSAKRNPPVDNEDNGDGIGLGRLGCGLPQSRHPAFHFFVGKA